MNKKLASTILFFCLIFGLSNILFAQEHDETLWDEVELTLNKEIYASIKTINVTVSLKGSPLLQGLEKQIKEEVESKLKKTGYIIGGIYPNLSIDISSNYTGNNISSFSVRLNLFEKFLLERDKSVSYLDIVWSRESKINATQIGNNSIKDAVLNLVDKFIEFCAKSKGEINKSPSVSSNQPKKTPVQPPQPKTNEDDSPFTATYVGGNSPPEIEIYNDTDRTLYIDFEEGLNLFNGKPVSKNPTSAYTIPSKTSKKIQLADGNYFYKASAARVSPLQGDENFQKGYRYTWRFTIITVRK